MKKVLKLLTLLAGGTLLLAGCDEFEANWPTDLPSIEEMNIDTPWTDYSNPCTAISFAKGEANLNLLKGDTHTYSYSVEPKDVDKTKFVWESDNLQVATIENGLLTAVGGGKANISLSCGDVIARSLVTVSVPITDFNVTNKDLSLDIEGSAQIEYTLEPADTTQNKVSYETTSSIISVSETGLITALGETGDAEIKVTNEGLNKVETVNVHVSDMWNYISSLSVTGPSKLEVTKSDILSTEVVAIDTSKDASTLATNSVTYSVKPGSETFISVDEETGEITGLEPGNTTIVASLFDERNENTVTKEFEVEVFEVSATALTLSESGTLELDNDTATSHQLAYTYTLNDTSFTEPSRGNISFATSDNKVATVNDNGLIEVVGPGTATITVKDLTYDVSDSIEVHTTIYAKSVTLAASGDFYLDESIEITANVVPANTSDDLVWDYDKSSGHTFVEDGNKLTVTCNNLDTPVEIKASVGSTQSNVLTLTPKEREICFESGKTYIVGSSNFKTGVSKDAEGGSWNTAKYAFVMTDKTGNAHAKYEYKAVIDFRANDEWKIRENVEDWRAISASNGRYKVDEGAFATGQMSVSGTPEEGNVLVNEAGKYDVYFAYYDDMETGWYEVYVEEHGMKLSSTSIHAKLTDPVTVSTITASNYEGTLAVSDVDEEIITVSVDPLTGNVSVTPVKVGETSFKVVDDVKEIEVSVEIKEGSDAKPTTFYIRGDAANGWGVSDDYVLRESADDNNYGEILDVYLKAGSFKIADENWSEGTVWGYEYGGHTTVIGGAADNFIAGDSDNNIKCNVAGYYDIYLTKNNYISIESAGVTPEPSPIYAYVLNGGDPVNLTIGKDLSGNDQLEALEVEMKAGDSIFFENIAPDTPIPLSLLTLGVPDDAHGFTITNGVLTASKDGKFSFYVKLIYGGDVVYISEVEDPTTFMWCIAGSANNWQLDTTHPFVQASVEGEDNEPLFTYKLNGFEFAKDSTWKVTNTKGEWVSNQSGVGFDSNKSTSGAFTIDGDGNIKTLTAGTYDITLNIWECTFDESKTNVLAGAQIYAVKSAAPATPSISFGIANPEVAVEDSLEIPVTATNCSGLVYSITEGSEYVSIDLTSSNDTKVVVNGNFEGTSVLKAEASDGTEKFITIECVESISPTPVGDTDFVILVQRKDTSEWVELSMSQTADIETQYEYTGDFSQGDIIKIHMDDETYYCFDDIKSGSPALNKAEITCENVDDIGFNKTGNYSIYSDSVDNEGHIWITRNIGPATMTIEGSSAVEMTPYEKNPGEFVLTNVHLAVNNFFSFEYDNVSVGYNNLKTSPVGVKSNQAQHIAVTTEGDYDIYFDTKAITGECIYIAQHVEMITYTIDFGSSWAFNDGAKIFAWVWSENKWVECTRVGTTNSVTVELTTETTGFNFVRADSSKTTSTVGWPPDGSWNQSSDLNATSGTYSYSLPWNG